MQAFRLPLVRKVWNTIKKYKLIEKGERVLVAVSGGPDSVALFLVLYLIKDRLESDLGICHYRHGVRVDDSKDFSVAKKLSERFNVPFFCGSGDAISVSKERKKGVEEACRFLRYSFFQELAEKELYNKVATGHTLNDNVETFLMRLMMGASLEGLKGIPPKRGIFVRPLIEVTRDEIIDFLRTFGEDFIVDETNIDDRITRNWIRLKLIPFMLSRNPSLIKVIGRSLNFLREDAEYLNSIADEVYASIPFTETCKDITFDMVHLKNLHPSLKRRVLTKLLYEKFYPGFDKALMADNVERILRMMETDKGNKEIKLKGGIVVKREYNKISIGFYEDTSKKEIREVLITGPGIYVFGEWVFAVKEVEYDDVLQPFSRTVAIFSASKIGYPLVFRTRRDGDRIFTKVGTKKLKDFFIDRKIPLSERDRIPILVTKDGEIIWVVGHFYRDNLKPLPGEKGIVIEGRKNESSD